MNYVRKLGFEETPDYDFLRELFTKVLKTLGEPEDGIFDWMLLNSGKGWEAGSSSAHLAQAHANASSPHHREHRREHRHRSSRQAQDPNSPALASPAAAHVKSRRTQERSRDIGTVQPLAPTSRRQSQQQREASALASVGLSAPHPYATAPSPNGYRMSGHNNNYGRQSPSPAVPLANGHGPVNPSDSFLYAQNAGKNGSRDGTMNGTAPREIHAPGAVRQMGVYDRDQMQRNGDQDDGHGRRKGIFGAFCCRA